ncbi:putative F-box protein At1g47730 [Humulus lupulus]|uniref:putative F-box protein At1g47730 n=1 Tax=Humulus lupulus TaxID=3486 RepID=UPI002B415693|nr:putative F-box protein At1g47730 [Humulus lupulus]
MRKIRCLNNDVFFDVLSLLPAKTLFQLKCVSKGWHNLISDRCFIHSQLQRTKLSISGFIFQEKFQWYNEDIKNVSYIPVDKEDFQLKQNIFDFLPEDVVALASSEGLVCCRSCFPTQDPAIYICNPLNKEMTKVRWAALGKDSNISLAFDPSQDSIDISTKFKLVTVEPFEIAEDEMYYTFEIYSSRTGEWWKSSEICQCNDNILNSKSIYIKGISHWLTDGDKILTFDLDKELSWLISVPVPASEFKSLPQACIGECGGQLNYVMISEEGLHLWCLEDYFESEWTLKHWKSLDMMEKEYPNFFCNLHERVMQDVRDYDSPWMNPLAFIEGLLLMRVSNKIYLYRFESGKMEEVCDAAKLGLSAIFYPTVLPYSMSLVQLSK